MMQQIQDKLKKAVARAAIKYVINDEIIGLGTGSTTNFFIDELNKIKTNIIGVVASSEATAIKLKQYGISVFNLNEVKTIPIYIDSADEITSVGTMIKGGGGALTREKIIASAAKKFICIVDSSKFVDVLGKFPLPVEVLPMACNIVTSKLSALGYKPSLRKKNGQPLLTDNNCYIIDVVGLHITAPIETETIINNIAGVVTVGLFAHQKANICLLSGMDGVKTLIF